MELQGKIVAVTGAASGIGKALSELFLEVGAARVAMIDLSSSQVIDCALSLDPRKERAEAYHCDVSVESELVGVLNDIEADLGPIDIMCSNAGIARGGGVEASDEFWSASWGVNLMAHVYAARFLVPRMAARGGGYFVHTASAAGLLTNLGAAPYAVTKHAAVALAEWMAITYRDQGIKVSCLCPQGVRTPMLFPDTSSGSETDTISQMSVTSAGEIREPREVAISVLEAIREEHFFVLPHPEVHDYLTRKVADPDRWIAGMARYNRKLSEPS